jgi:hypothetical protein
MTDQELKQYVKDQIMSFVGRLDRTEIEAEMKEMLQTIMLSNPDQLDIIFQAIQEGPENANT